MAAISSSSTAYFSPQPQLPSTTASPSSSSGGKMATTRRSSSFVTVEAAPSPASGSGAVARTKSLTEDDLAELKGCLDLGFGFAYHEIPELCGTLPALQLCYSMTRRFLHEQRAPGEEQEPEPEAASLPNWRISAPGKYSMLD
jgi:hypothetical protein